MVICENCKKLIKDAETFTLEVNGRKVEIEKQIHDKGKKLSDIQIPKGWRLLKLDEVIALFNSEYLDELMPKDQWSWFFFEQPVEYNKQRGLIATAIRSWNSELGLGLGGVPGIVVGGLGVVFAKISNTKRKVKTK